MVYDVICDINFFVTLSKVPCDIEECINLPPLLGQDFVVRGRGGNEAAADIQLSSVG